MNILVVGPHPDDQELGMGGTIARLASHGHNVLLLDMTNGEPTPHGSAEKRREEARRATEILRVTRKTLEFPNRELTHTLEARRAVAEIIREHRAEIVFAPYFEDAHPDHVATTRIVEDARFDAKLTKTALRGEPIYPRWLFHYYCTHLRHVANPSFLIDITGFEEKKRQAILAYESQFVVPERNKRIVDWIDAMNVYFGSRLPPGGDGSPKAAEPFYTREPIAFTSLDSLA